MGHWQQASFAHEDERAVGKVPHWHVTRQEGSKRAPSEKILELTHF
jgi:hypothetical protein